MLSSEIFGRVLVCAHSYELCGKLLDFFQKQICAVAQQLRVELRFTFLENRIVQEYLLHIHLLIDRVSIGDPEPINQHVVSVISVIYVILMMLWHFYLFMKFVLTSSRT